MPFSRGVENDQAIEATLRHLQTPAPAPKTRPQTPARMRGQYLTFVAGQGRTRAGGGLPPEEEAAWTLLEA